MNGVMMPDASAGSNQVGASETWTPQVSWSGDAARRKARAAGHQTDAGRQQDVATADRRAAASRTRFAAIRT